MIRVEIREPSLHVCYIPAITNDEALREDFVQGDLVLRMEVSKLEKLTLHIQGSQQGGIQADYPCGFRGAKTVERLQYEEVL